jgi:hypothetical protein
VLRRLGLVVVVFGLGLASACSYTPSALDDWPEEPSCGRYENRNDPALAEQRWKNRCLLDAAAEGRPAQLVLTYMTVEGDPITEYYRVLGPRRVEIFVDATQDPLGSDQWTHLLCDEVAEDGGLLYAVAVGCREISVDETVE